MANDRVVVITGATGKQGGATIQELAGKGLAIRAMTRKPDGEAARALGALPGVQVVAGDLDDAVSLEKVLAGAWGVFAVQNTWEAGVEREEEQGKRLAEVARRIGVQHYVYSSVGSAHRSTGIPHFDNKWRIEETVRRLEFPSHVIVRPVFFMENLLGPFFINDGKFYSALKPETAVQMIAVNDIGRYAALAFTQADRLAGREIDLAGDSATMPQAAAVMASALGTPLELVEISIDQVRQNSEDYAIMLEWFDRVGYNADIAGLEREFGIVPTRLAAWATQAAQKTGKTKTEDTKT